MPPVFAVALGLMGAAALVRWYVRETQRINADIEHGRQRATVEPDDRSALPTLKRDPRTGEYRPG
jgi:hypothetical protein